MASPAPAVCILPRQWSFYANGTCRPRTRRRAFPFLLAPLLSIFLWFPYDGAGKGRKEMMSMGHGPVEDGGQPFWGRFCHFWSTKGQEERERERATRGPANTGRWRARATERDATICRREGVQQAQEASKWENRGRGATRRDEEKGKNDSTGRWCGSPRANSATA